MYGKDADAEFLQLISRTNQERIRGLEQENHEVRECLRMLQREMIEIVAIKQDSFWKRYEISTSKQLDPNDPVLKPVIKPLSEETFNISFQKDAKIVVTQFEQNILRLREFLTKIDKDNE